MKQLKKLAVLAFSLAALSFIACSDDDDDDNFTTQTVSAKSVEKGASIAEEVSVSCALSDSGKTKYAAGADVTNSFTQTSVSMSSASASISSPVSALFSTTSPTISNFRVVVKSVSGDTIVFTITGTAPSGDAKVLFAVAIQAEDTASGKVFAKNVKVLNVGNASASVSSDALDMSKMTIPSASDLAGKTLNRQSGSSYTFDSTGNTATKGSSSYTYKDGSLYEGDKEKKKIRMYNGVCYVIDDDIASRTNGSGLFARFGMSEDTVSQYLDFSSDGTVSYGGSGKYATSTIDIYGSGVYTNNGGILTCDMNVSLSYSSESNGTKQSYSQSQSTEGNIAIYDGSKIYFADIATIQ